MAWTVVGSIVTAGDTGNTTSLAFAAQNHATGDDIFVGVGWNFGGGATASVSDTAGNTYVDTGVQAVIGSNAIRLFWAHNITGHATNVVLITYTAGAVYRSGAMRVFTPPAGTVTQNDADTGAGNSTSLSTPALSMTGTDGLIITFQMAIGDSNAAGSGYTLNAYAITGDAIQYWAMQYKAVSAGEAPAATCGSGLWGMVAASFAVAAAAPASFGFFLD